MDNFRQKFQLETYYSSYLSKSTRWLGIVFVFISFSGFHWWDPVARWIGIGNQEYESGNLENAQKAYDHAEQINPGNPLIANNQGNVLYRQENYEDAEKKFQSAAMSEDPKAKADALYNAGCAALMNKDPQTAVNSFQKSLALAPQDEDAKVNLEMALKMLQQMPTPTPQSQENQDGEQDSSQTPEPQPSPGLETPTPSGTPESESSQTEQSESTPEATPTSSEETSMDDTEQKPTPEPQQEGEMSEEEATRLLDAMEDEEMEVLKKFHQLPQPERELDKDW